MVGKMLGGNRLKRRSSMSFKDVIVVFADSRGASARLNVAVEIARRDGAHLIGLYATPAITLFAGGLPYSGSVNEIKALELVEAQTRGDARKAADEVEAALNDAAARAGVTCEWRLVEGDIDRTAVLHARYADIAIVGQNDPEHPAAHASNLAEALLLGSGRPVIVVPYAGRFDAVGRSVLVAWNATREAARAVNDAMPILVRAANVIVFSVNPPGTDAGGPAVPGADLALHLARHGVKAEASSTVSHEIDAGNTILSRAADFDSDLIVMGGYGHSRQREFMLGGATRTLLRQMTVPVLLSH
jgi:nucleotide-binding universal stress UspA family protein